MTTTADLLAQATKTLARVEEEKARATDAFNAEIRSLKAAIRALERKKTPARKAAVQAGPAALNKIRAALADGPLSQAQITRQTGLNDGTVSYGLRALADAGEIEATGVRISGSREFRLLHVAERSVA